MKRTGLKILSVIAAASCLVVACNQKANPSDKEDSGKGDEPQEDTTKRDEKPLVDDPEFHVKQDTKTLTDCGQVVTFSINTNIAPEDWEYTTSAEGLVEVLKDSTQLQLALTDDLDMYNDRDIKVVFTCPRYDDLGASTNVIIKKALLVDVGFNGDGTATDHSSNSFSLNYYPGTNLVTYMNDEAGQYVARFFNSLGSDVTDSYYKISYSSNSKIKDALTDGHSFEVQFMLATANNCSGEVCMMSATESGGTGIMLTNSSYGRDIAFVPNVNVNKSSNWHYARSGVIPEVGKYYHVVGVWNQNEGKAYIYVNGELKGSTNAAGSLILPSATTAWWIGVGADAGKSGGEAAWNGDIVLARVYDAALSAAAVQKLWQAADKDFKELEVKISDVLYFSDGKVNPGAQMVVSGEGFESGDQIVLKSISDDTVYNCETTFGTGKVVYAIPSDFKSGSYTLYVKRGTAESPLGLVSFTVTDTPVIRTAPGLIAHRGAYYESSLPENSIASLKKAQELGCFASETDLWITTDDVIYINHDGVISGKTIQNSTSAELANVKLSNGEKLPTFTEYLDQVKQCPGTKLSIEIKDHNEVARELKCVDEAVRIVNEYGLMGQTEWNAFDWDTMVYLHKIAPDAVIYFQVEDTSIPLQKMKDAGFTGGDYDYFYIFDHPELVEEAHALGMFIVAGTVDTESYFMRCASLCVDQISTNRPSRLGELSDRMFK